MTSIAARLKCFWHDQRQQAFVLFACVFIHAALIAWLLINIATRGNGGGAQLIYVSTSLTALPEHDDAPTPSPPPVPPPPVDAVIDFDDSLPPKLAPLPAQIVPNPIASATPASNNSVYDDPYAGAAVSEPGWLSGANANPAPLPAAIVQPQLDVALWQSIIRELARAHGSAHNLALLVQIDSRGIIIDCQSIGGDAPPALLEKARARLIGKPLFTIVQTTTDSQWLALPEIVF